MAISFKQGDKLLCAGGRWYDIIASFAEIEEGLSGSGLTLGFDVLNLGLIFEDREYSAILLLPDWLGRRWRQLSFLLPEVEEFEDVVLDGLDARPVGLHFSEVLDVGCLGSSDGSFQLGKLLVEVSSHHLGNGLAVLVAWVKMKVLLRRFNKRLMSSSTEWIFL